ncbi:MAG: Rossmann-like domain, partial [Pseudomonadota bacterium]
MIANIIGAGHVGQVLARLLQQHAGWQIQDVCNRSPASSSAAIAAIGGG